ncbi:S24 family peptidase [Hymenobacter sp. P5342]|uniref:S24 family peptidase n=2 Tax=Hymenobacter lapidiphilus TaxID=2608003 RepID=A0A7Y7PM48_9BACT|nr:S24 family peptidase [Hymenobacter lapidiphilus]
MKDADSEVEKMPAVVYRIQEMMSHYNLNTNSMAKELGYTATSKLYGIMGGSAPSFGTLTDILDKWPEVSSDWLVLGRGPMLRSAGGAATPAAPAPKAPTALSRSVVNNGGVLVVTVDKDGEDNVEMVPVAAQAGYATQHNEAVFVQDLPRYRLPGFERGKFRAFEVAGDSMEPTLNHRDIVVCSLVDNWRLLVPDDMYVVVTDESVMLKRIRVRIEDRNGEVILHSDNPHRRPYPLDCADITELWRVRGYISTYLPSTPDVTVERLWEVIEALGFDRAEVRRHLDENAPNSTPIS